MLVGSFTMGFQFVKIKIRYTSSSLFLHVFMSDTLLIVPSPLVYRAEVCMMETKLTDKLGHCLCS